MEVSVVTELVASLGFPIAVAIALAIIVYKVIHVNGERMDLLFKALQTSSDAREEKLLKELHECRQVNATAISTIALYAEKLETIQRDVSEIKVNIVHLSGSSKRE